VDHPAPPALTNSWLHGKCHALPKLLAAEVTFAKPERYDFKREAPGYERHVYTARTPKVNFFETFLEAGRVIFCKNGKV
jgi:hypothetical protein